MYNDFIEDTLDAMGSNVDATYGIKGKAASWGDTVGVSGQYVTPLIWSNNDKIRNYK